MPNTRPVKEAQSGVSSAAFPPGSSKTITVTGSEVITLGAATELAGCLFYAVCVEAGSTISRGDGLFFFIDEDGDELLSTGAIALDADIQIDNSGAVGAVASHVVFGVDQTNGLLTVALNDGALTMMLIRLN